MAIFVLGMHRSGTSMVASILQSLGVNLGPDEDMVPANQFNTAGYFENAPAVAINDVFLKKNDLNWRTLPAIESRASLSGIDEYTASISKVVEGLDLEKPWCLKDPRLSFLLPHWKTAAKPMSAIICLRRPDAAALSLKTRNDLSVSYAAALWELYTLAALRNTRRMMRAVVVYEELLAKPKQTIEKLIAALPELAELNPGASAIKAAVERVRRDLDHSKPVNSKSMPPAVLDLYERLASGNLTLTKEDNEPGVAFELVRLEAGHQSAKRLNTEAREQLARANEQLAAQKAAFARHTERLGDIVGLVARSGEGVQGDSDGLLDRLRDVVRNVPGPEMRARADEVAHELLRAKDERIEWLRQELGANGARTQTILDQSVALETEAARLRAEHEQQGLLTATHQREIMRLADEVQRLHRLLVKAEEDRTTLQRERILIKSEYETSLAQMTAERAIIAGTMESLHVRLDEKEALIAQIQAERLDEEATATNLRRIAGERETLVTELARATEALALRNKELAEIATRERALAQRAYKLDDEIERLQRDLSHSRAREVDLTSALVARERSEAVMRAAVAQQDAVASEIQLQLSGARETIESLEKALEQRTRHSEELEAQNVANRRVLAEYEVRTPLLEAAAVDRAQLSARNAELKAEIQRIITERDQALEKKREAAAGLEKQVAELNQKLAEATSAAQRTAQERDEALAAVGALDKTIRERDKAIDALNKIVAEATAMAPQKGADTERTRLLEQQVANLDKQLAELNADYAASHAVSAGVAREASELRAALEIARTEVEKATARASEAEALATAASHDESSLKAEHAELTRALQSARDRAEQLKAELTTKTAATPAAGKATPATDQRLRRQLLVLNELLQTIDKLLSPKYGRFAIPVRQIRVRLTQARQVVDGEVAMTRR